MVSPKGGKISSKVSTVQPDTNGPGLSSCRMGRYRGVDSLQLRRSRPVAKYLISFPSAAMAVPEEEPSREETLRWAGRTDGG